MLRSSLFVVWGVIGCCMKTHAQEWIRHRVSCDFGSGQCGWSDDRNATRHWSRSSTLGPIGDDYMALDMEDAQVNDSGLLSSPPLHGSLNQTCSLSFYRHIKSDNHACQLLVFMVTETNWTLLWRTSDRTRGGFLGLRSERSPDLPTPCTEPNFKIVFEGKKINSGSCGGTVDINDIEFYTKQQQPSSTLSATTTLVVPSTSIATSNTQVGLTTFASGSGTELSTESTNSEAEENKRAGLSSGVVAAVVAGVVAVLVVLTVVGVVILLRRRAHNQGQTHHCIPCLCPCKTRPKTRSPTQSAAPNNVVYRNNHDSPNTSFRQANPGSGGAVTSQGEGHTASGHLYSTVDDYRQYSSLDHQQNTQDDHRYSALGHQHRTQGNSPADYQNCVVDHAQYSTIDHQQRSHDDHRYSCLDPPSRDDNRHSAADDYLTLVDVLDDGYERPSPSGVRTRQV